MVIYFTENFTGVLEYIKETFWMLPVSIIKKKYFRGLSNVWVKLVWLWSYLKNTGVKYDCNYFYFRELYKIIRINSKFKNV